MNRATSLNEKGFTLLEVLIAFAITCIVLAALYSTFFLSQRAVDAVDNSLLRLQESRSVLDILKRELESAYPGTKDYSVFRMNDRDFYGKQASQLTFASFSPFLPGLAKISYTVEENGKKLALKKTITSAYLKSAENRPVELMEDIESFTVEAKFNGKWVKTWDSTLTNNLPDEIRITVNISAGNGEAPITISDIARTRVGRSL